MKYELSIVIPCYNEEQNIRLGALDKVAHFLDKQKFSWETLIVDDGSTDESLELAKKFALNNPGFRVIANPHQGKAGTVVSGMLAAQGEAVLFTDLDQATPIDQITKLSPWLSKGYDIVIGSRKNRRRGAPFLRRLMGPGFMIVRNLLLGLGDIQDTQCGFKLFKNRVAKDVFQKLELYRPGSHISGPRVTAGFDVEVLFISSRQGYKIKEVPVEWHYVDTRRVSPLADSWDALMGIIKIRLNDLRGLYRQRA